VYPPISRSFHSNGCTRYNNNNNNNKLDIVPTDIREIYLMTDDFICLPTDKNIGLLKKEAEKVTKDC
jgi:hypothetical protein